MLNKNPIVLTIQKASPLSWLKYLFVIARKLIYNVKHFDKSLLKV